MADTGSNGARGNAFKLFHSVVVLGAALGSACGQAASLEPGALGGQGGSTGGRAGQGSGGSAGALGGGGATLTIDTAPGPRSCDYAGNLRGTAEAPLGPADCPMPEQFSCKAGSSGATECSCDLGAPIVPTDCAITTQFDCVVVDLAHRACCSCDLGAPTDASACSYGWSCRSYDPPVGCHCNVVIL